MRWTRSFFSSRKTLQLGVDITPSAVKILVLNSLEKQYCVQAYGQELLPDQVIKGHDILDVSALTNSIQTLLLKLELNPNQLWALQAAIAVPDACTLHRTIQVSDRIKNADLEELVSMELAKYIPETLADIYYDFKYIGNAVSAGMKEVWIVAARAKYIRDRVDALRNANILTTTVEVESLALQRIMPFLMQEIHGQLLIAILDLGLSELKVYFFKQTTLLFVHEEEINPISNAENTYLKEVLLKFKRAKNFLSTKFSQNETLSQIFLAGPGAQNPENVQGLQQFFACPILSANPFTHLQINHDLCERALHRDAPLYLTAFGLAKRGC